MGAMLMMTGLVVVFLKCQLDWAMICPAVVIHFLLCLRVFSEGIFTELAE